MFDRPENNMQFILGVKGNAAKTMCRISFKQKNKTKQNKTKQNKTKQNKTKNKQKKNITEASTKLQYRLKPHRQRVSLVNCTGMTAFCPCGEQTKH